MPVYEDSEFQVILEKADCLEEDLAIAAIEEYCKPGFVNVNDADPC